MLRKLEGRRSHRVCDIVTEDKTRVTNTTRDEATVGGVGFPDVKPPVKFKRNRNASKQMKVSGVFVCFLFFVFGVKFGHVATILLEDRKTVTADWHINHCLPKVFQAWCKLRL